MTSLSAMFGHASKRNPQFGKAMNPVNSTFSCQENICAHKYLHVGWHRGSSATTAAERVVSRLPPKYTTWQMTEGESSLLQKEWNVSVGFFFVELFIFVSLWLIVSNSISVLSVLWTHHPSTNWSAIWFDNVWLRSGKHEFCMGKVCWGCKTVFAMRMKSNRGKLVLF